MRLAGIFQLRMRRRIREATWLLFRTTDIVFDVCLGLSNGARDAGDRAALWRPLSCRLASGKGGRAQSKHSWAMAMHD